MCFNFRLLEKQRHEMATKLFSQEWSAEEYYEAAHRRQPPFGYCPNCQASHDLPFA